MLWENDVRSKLLLRIKKRKSQMVPGERDLILKIMDMVVTDNTVVVSVMVTLVVAAVLGVPVPDQPVSNFPYKCSTRPTIHFRWQPIRWWRPRKLWRWSIR